MFPAPATHEVPFFAKFAEEMANVVHNPPAHVQKDAHIKSMDEYRAMYERSINDPAVSLSLRRHARTQATDDGHYRSSAIDMSVILHHLPLTPSLTHAHIYPTGLLGRIRFPIPLEQEMGRGQFPRLQLRPQQRLCQHQMVPGRRNQHVL